MADFKLSEYQEKIQDFYNTYPESNILVNAKAGSGKSSTICLLTENNTLNSIYLAFNASVAEEFKKKINNPKTKVSTIHSLAYSIMRYNVEKMGENISSGFGKKIGQEIKIDGLKIYNIVEEYLCKKNIDFLERVFLKENCVRLFSIVRLSLIDFNNKKEIEKAIKEYSLFIDFEHNFAVPSTNELVETISYVMDKDWEIFAHSFSVDFDDMLFLTYWKLKKHEWEIPYWAYYSNVYVDECVPENAYVTNGENIYTLKSLFNKQQKGKMLPNILSFNDRKKTFELDSIKKISKIGRRPVFTITTEGLNKITVTGNHPILTQRGYIPLEMLEIGKDWVVLDKPNNQKAKYVLNDDQLQLVLASSIGDGYLTQMSNYNTYRIKFTQGDAQYRYFQFKKQLLNCTFENKNISGYTGKYTINQCATKIFALPDSPWNLMETLDERFLAIWYQDDGSIQFYYTKTEGRKISCIVIACNNLSQDKINYLKTIIENKFGIKGELCFNRQYAQLRFSGEDAHKYLKKIAPFMNEDCAYKNPYFNKSNLYIWDDKFLDYGVNFIKKIEYLGEKEVYDLEMNTNHNFILKTTNQINVTGMVVHNCQDLNKLQQNFLPFIKRKNGRFVFVGDFFQAIYKFAAADANSFKRISSLFSPIAEFNLPICYRCPTSHLTKVNKEFGISILPRENAPTGEIQKIEKDKISKYVKGGDLIISRLNKWLAPVILDLATHGIPVCIPDKELVENLKKVVTKRAKKCPTTRALREWFDKDIRKYQDRVSKIVNSKILNEEHKENLSLKEQVETVADSNSKIDNINFVLEILKYYQNKNGNTSTTDFQKYLDKLLNTSPSSNCVTLSSVHKAKGLEADNVFVLNEGKVCFDPRNSPELQQQERNLSYISLTRAKNKMYLVKEPTAQNKK